MAMQHSNHRHCERSEAIHVSNGMFEPLERWIASAKRPRNDGLRENRFESWKQSSWRYARAARAAAALQSSPVSQDKMACLRLGRIQPRRMGLSAPAFSKRGGLKVVLRSLIGLACSIVLLTTVELCKAADPPDDQEHLRAAIAYYDAGNYEHDAKMQVKALLDHYAQMIAERGGRSNSETIAKIEDIVAPDFQPIVYEMKARYVKALEDHVSTADLEELTRWIKTPIGMRFTAAKSLITADIQSGSISTWHVIYSKIWVNHKDEILRLGLAFPGASH